jgi:hypothetical protein
VITIVIGQSRLRWRDCHLRERRRLDAARVPVIRQLRARGRNGRPRRAAGHPLARHIEDFLTDLANANKPPNTIRAYHGDLTGFAAYYDSEIAGLSAAPIRAFRRAWAAAGAGGDRVEPLAEGGGSVLVVPRGAAGSVMSLFPSRGYP